MKSFPPINRRWAPSHSRQPGEKVRRVHGDGLQKHFCSLFLLFEQFRPLVINRLLTGRNEFVSVLSKALGLSRRRLIDTFLDYAIAYIEGRDSFVRGHVFNEAFRLTL